MLVEFSTVEWKMFLSHQLNVMLHSVRTLSPIESRNSTKAPILDPTYQIGRKLRVKYYSVPKSFGKNKKTITRKPDRFPLNSILYADLVELLKGNRT